ncbi:hypothetical protein CEXT_463291 [Caerostris extrusa]|uniref:Uncharacterized protein n=1 Tax=Caerostris extrusa TaxID=172846 RepID=A0AAV4SDY2_CAEEX|nr:hypothetical protein CEXT_463291 [Caerostris extrusa]
MSVEEIIPTQITSSHGSTTRKCKKLIHVFYQEFSGQIDGVYPKKKCGPLHCSEEPESCKSHSEELSNPLNSSREENAEDLLEVEFTSVNFTQLKNKSKSKNPIWQLQPESGSFRSEENVVTIYRIELYNRKSSATQCFACNNFHHGNNKNQNLTPIFKVWWPTFPQRLSHLHQLNAGLSSCMERISKVP